MTTAITHIDSVETFERLARTMASAAERYEHLGDIELELAIIMRRGDDQPFRVLLRFDGIQCTGVSEIPPGGERAADCWLDGDLGDWSAMFADIAEHGHATGPWTLNTLTLFGDRIRLGATDPMGEDRFHRFNQTLQEFVDGAAEADQSRPDKE